MFTKNTLCVLFAALFILLNNDCFGQNTPITFEQGGFGSTWVWTTFENDTNPAVQIITNPVAGGINTSDKVAKFTALQAGQPWAGFESLHGGGIGTFTLDTTNSIIKVMVYKSVISDVGVKLVTPSAASTGELKVANTLINQWEELTFDFTSQIGHPAMIGIDQIVIFPDFDLSGRTGDNVCYIDNIRMGTPTTPINVTFEVQNTDSTPVYVFGNWNNWSNFPGTPMVLNASGSYEVSIPLPPNSTIEYLFVNGTSTKELLDSAWACTNGNGQYTNRLTTLGVSDTTLCNIWSSCASCVPLSTEAISNLNVEFRVGTKHLRINTNSPEKFDQLEIYDLLGKQIFNLDENILSNSDIPVNLNTNTFYVLRVRKANKYFTTKTIITN